MNILVINCGSSSIKYRIFNLSDYTILASGLIEKIGDSDSRLSHSWLKAENRNEQISESRPVPDHRNGFDWIVDVIAKTSSDRDSTLLGIGHRVVHGGEVFREPTLINDEVITAIQEVSSLAPLHNPANLVGIQVARERRPDVPQVAVFDTAFHQTMPPEAYHYALPKELYDNLHIRKYGFHGTSHHYVAKIAAEHLGKALDTLNMITLHLGNGASATAIRGGNSVDTSMGMTPMEGLVMGTRCGDMDPAIHFHLIRETGKTLDELERMLNQESGLKGICGENDMREITRLANSGDEDAQRAIDITCYRIRKYIGAYSAILGTVDLLVFTGGVGENSAIIRRGCCNSLEHQGMVMDHIKNEAHSGGISEIQGENSSVKIIVIPTDEEREIAIQTHKLISQNQ